MWKISKAMLAWTGSFQLSSSNCHLTCGRTSTPELLVTGSPGDWEEAGTHFHLFWHRGVLPFDYQGPPRKGVGLCQRFHPDLAKRQKYHLQLGKVYVTRPRERMDKKGFWLFDVTMECYDGAEVCELVGMFAFSRLAKIQTTMACTGMTDWEFCERC